MQVIECPSVDLISPFPLQEIPRLRRWMYCYKSLIIDDTVNGDEETFEKYLFGSLSSPAMQSWGIIDRDNKTNSKHEAPLVGFVGFEIHSVYNGYFHAASSRSSWGNGFIDEAGKKLLDHVFATVPSLLRVSCAILDRNKPAKALAYRLGFSKDGRFENFVLQNGQPLAVVHFGLTRERWNELCLHSET